MAEKIWGNQYQTTVICIDSYNDCIPVGWVSNPYLTESVPFCGTIHFLKVMECLLDEIKLPQSFSELRKFSDSTTPVSIATQPGTAGQNGKMATFSIRILFRQNSSWQGTLIWMNNDREERFRSVLELLMLLDSALSV